MAYDALKPTVIVDTALGLLTRDTVLPGLIWRDAGGDFRGALNDTISIRLPAYVKANKRGLRSSDARVQASLFERKVDVTLTSDLQVDIPITSEELTLDIRSFSENVMAPAVGAILRGYEDEVVALMQGATYPNEVTFSESAAGTEGSAYEGTVDARKFLNDARVPQSGRAIVLGSALEALFLKDPRFIRADMAGSAATMRNSQIGTIAGFPVISVPALDPDEGYAFHRTAYVLSARAPVVPQGAPWGASQNAGGFAIRALQYLDTTESISDVLALDAWVGTNVVTDVGALDSDGRFEPAVDPSEPGASELFVRAVKLTLGP